MARVTVQHGVGTEVAKEYAKVGDVMADKRLETYLGADFAAVTPYINNQAADNSDKLEEGDVIDLRAKSHKKG